MFFIQDTYYIAASTVGNNSKNAKGKLPDKWQIVLTQLRNSSVLNKHRKRVPTQTVVPINGKNYCMNDGFIYSVK